MQKLGNAEYSNHNKYIISISQNSIVVTIANVAVFYLLIVFYVYYLIDYSFLNIRVFSTGVVAVVCVLASIIASGYKSLSKTIWFPFLMVICWLMGFLSYEGHYSNFADIYCSISYFFIAQWFIVCKKHKSVFYEILFYIVFATIIYKVYIQHIPIMNILQDGSSYNFISVVGLFYFMVSNFVRLQEGKSISLVQSICLLILAVTGFGRGGIAASLILLALVLFNKYGEGKSTILKLIVSFLSVVVIAAIIVNFETIFQFVLESTNFLGKFAVKGTFNGDRMLIWSSYIKDACGDPWKFIFGGNAYVMRADGNLHNSFLQMHAQYGILFLIVNIWLLIRLIRRIYITRNKEIVILLVVFVVRCFTDRLMFHGFSEVIYYMFISYLLLNPEVKARTNGH